MIERDTELQITSEPAIAYSTCYRLPFLSLFPADCMEIMKPYPDTYFDLAIVDPPYGIKWSDRKDDSFVKRHNKTKAFNSNMKWDNKPDSEYWEELKRVSKNQIVWGINYFSKHFDYFIPVYWNKMNGESQYSDGELCGITFTNKSRIINHAYIGRYNPEPIKIHPTQKPYYVYEKLIGWYATEGMKILDTHFGSGSIALAVDKANRLDKMNLHLTACEIDKEYIDKAIKRISESIKQGTLSF